MQIRTHSAPGVEMLYDAGRLPQPDPRIFDPQYWEARGALAGQASGRGTTWFVQNGDEQWALRHYRRGGLVARFIRDQYLWLGLARTRAWREWHLTAELHRRGLPVPAPVAARVCRQGLAYRADLITRRIPAVESLSQRLQHSALEPAHWRGLGRQLRRFHDAGLDHADLNAHNLLLDGRGGFWLIDFDKSRLRQAGAWTQGNLDRLHRSLVKLQGQCARFEWTAQDWAELRAGYAGG